MIHVRALPRSFDADHVRIVGENIFCDQWDPDDEKHGAACPGLPEVEITIAIGSRKKARLILCRQCAGDIATQIREVIELADGGDIMRTRARRDGEVSA